MKNKEFKVFNKKVGKLNIDLISDAVLNFQNLEGGFGDRNIIKNIEVNGGILNIKSFKIPHLINKIAYSFFRKSKANRSFEYANILLKFGVKTPNPIAFFEFKKFGVLNRSYYISEQFNCDLTYRELVEIPAYKDHEKILRAFTQFTFQLHEKGILFKDHSPGNTLIRIKEERYDFYLVDLNRMEFKELDFETRINNFARLTPKKEMVKVMANEYAKLINENESKVFNKMWSVTEAFQKKYHDKIALKRKIFFWKKKYKNS